MFAPFILGFFTTALFFLISLIIVLGVKTIYLAIINKFNKNDNENAPVQQTQSAPIKSKRQRKTTRTIEIDPDLADRIYFKKSS